MHGIEGVGVTSVAGFVRDRLIAGHEINDAQPRMTEADALIGRQPGALAVWTPVPGRGPAGREGSRSRYVSGSN
jgi:hypothetical protein